MTQQNDSFSKNLRKIGAVFVQALPSLFLFELIFKGLCLFLFLPIGRELIAMMLRISGDHVLFNYQILNLLFSMPGIAAILLILCLSSLLTYFEFSVLFLKLYGVFSGSSHSIRHTMKLSMTTFMSISNFGIIGYFIYSVLLLPFEAIFLRPSIMPRVQIPNFITAEFSKRWYGSSVLNFAYAILFFLFLFLLFVLPVMILKHQSFFRSCKACVNIWKKGKISDFLFLFFLIGLWIVLFIRPGFLSNDFSELFEETMVKTVCMIFLTGETFLQAVLALLIWSLKTVLMLFFCTVLLSFFLRADHEILFSVQQLDQIDAALHSTQSIITTVYVKIHDYFRPLVRRIHLSRSAKTAVLLACVLSFGLFLYGLVQSPPYLHKPVIIGHRGSDLGIENTVEAVNGAIQSGADFVELDVQLSKDGIPVVMHDDNLSRLGGSSEAVRDLTLEELKDCELKQDEQTSTIPSLEELMQDSGDEIRMLIEFKASSAQDKEQLVDAVLRLIDAYDFEKRCLLMSLDYDMVRMSKSKNPALKVGYCMFGNVGETTVQTLLDLHVDFVAIEESMVTKEFVSACRKAWLPVYVWTVDDESNMKKYLDMGVIGLISDKPYLVRDIVSAQTARTSRNAAEYYWGNRY